MNKVLKHTPKLDAMIEFVSDKAKEGHINPKILNNLKEQLTDTVIEVTELVKELTNKEVNKVGWAAFMAGIVVGSISQLVIMYLYF
jgi:hypothetical protein